MFRPSVTRHLLLSSLVASLHCSAPSNAPAPAPASSAGATTTTDDGITAATCAAGTPVTISKGKVVSEVTVGPATLRVVFDTGAPQSVFSTRVPGVVRGKPLAFRFAGRDVSVKSAYVSDGAIDTLRMNGIDAVVGLDAVEGKTLTLDYVRSRIVLEDAPDDRALAACEHVEADAAWVPTTRKKHVFVKASVDGLEGWALLDSGASLGVLTESAFGELMKRAPRPSLGGFYTPAALGTFWARMTIIDAMSVGGTRSEHVLARTIDDRMLDVFAPEDAPFLGVIPSDFFMHTMVTYDLATSRVRFARERGAPTSLPSRLFPTGIELEERTELPVRVANVLAGSAAEEAGIVAGDEVVSIQEQDVSALDAYTRAFALAPSRAGVKVPVVTRRGEAISSHQLEGRDLL